MKGVEGALVNRRANSRFTLKQFLDDTKSHPEFAAFLEEQIKAPRSEVDMLAAQIVLPLVRAIAKDRATFEQWANQPEIGKLSPRSAIEALQTANSTRARRNATKRLANDPKQAAKADAYKLWNERRAGMHPKLRTNEQFATECMRRWPALKSAKVILGWCTNWNKAARVRKSQSAS